MYDFIGWLVGILWPVDRRKGLTWLNRHDKNI